MKYDNNDIIHIQILHILLSKSFSFVYLKMQRPIYEKLLRIYDYMNKKLHSIQIENND